MKVILLKDIRGVGLHREVREVTDGYARNFLLPQGLVEAATDEKIKKLHEDKKVHEVTMRKQEEELEGKIAALRGKTVTLTARATPKGGLFKSISAGDIARALKEQYGADISDSAVHISEPIKTVGEHIVALQSKTQKVEIGAAIVAAT